LRELRLAFFIVFWFYVWKIFLIKINRFTLHNTILLQVALCFRMFLYLGYLSFVFSSWVFFYWKF
jgi:hypothetical protein